MAFLFYFVLMNYINLNGKFLLSNEPALLASNRGYRYGDGLFETIKVYKGELLLSQLHFSRLIDGIAKLKFDLPKLFSTGKLEEEILNLCKKNKCENLARVRASLFRGNGGLYDNDRMLQYVIECWPLNESVNELNDNGLVIDIYPDARKSCDIFSNLKSANFLPYSMAAVYAKENKLNDCLVLNTNGNIADSTIANLFIIKNDIISTPSLNEGCVNGVMRKYLLSALRNAGYNIQETIVTINDFSEADEVLLTNAINGIRWIRQFRNKTFFNFKTAEIYNRIIKTITP